MATQRQLIGSWLGTSRVIINVQGRYGNGMSRLSKTIRNEN